MSLELTKEQQRIHDMLNKVNAQKILFSKIGKSIKNQSLETDMPTILDQLNEYTLQLQTILVEMREEYFDQ